MPISEFYRLGEKAGRVSVGKNLEGIRGSPDTADLAKLAGRCLLHLQNEADRETSWYVRNPEFSTGFFDGFMNRAEDFKT